MGWLYKLESTAGSCAQGRAARRALRFRRPPLTKKRCAENRVRSLRRPTEREWTVLAGVRKFFESSAGRSVAIGLLVVGVAAAVYSIVSSVGGGSASLSRDRTFICSETGKAFEYEIEVGTTIPVPSPYSGKNTGYAAEYCFWTKDGKIKEEPTLVLLNQHVGKPGPTFCPDCGRLVTPLNPAPVPGLPPPPTDVEYKKIAGREQ